MKGFVRMDNGAEFHLLHQSFLQGRDYAIAHLRRQSESRQEFEVLVSSSGENMFGYLDLVRAKGAQETQLYFTKRQLLVAMKYGNRAIAAYDLSSGKSYSGEEMTNLSPFLLLSPTDAPRQSDFDTLLATDDYAFFRPKLEVVKGEFSNPNPEVRALARKLHAHLIALPKKTDG